MLYDLDKVFNIRYKDKAVYDANKFRESFIKYKFENVNELIDYCSNNIYDYNCVISFGYNKIEHVFMFRIIVKYEDIICILQYIFEGFVFKYPNTDEHGINNYLNSSIKKAKRINLIDEILK